MIKHTKVSSAPDDGNATHVQGTDWNADHSIDDAAALTAAINTVTTTLKGLAPASGGGIANVLRADLTWAAPPGRLLAIQVLSAASGTYTPTPGTKFVHGYSVGGGGGSGGVPTCSGNQSASSGGGSGVCVEWTAGTPGGASAITGGAFACGAAGTAGATTPTNGGQGGDSTIVVNGATITAKGGGGGLQGSAGAASSLVNGGQIQPGSTAGILNHAAPGFPGVNISATVFWGGRGGSSPMGSGGTEGLNGNNGGAGTGFGAGGGGASTNGTARAGSVGTIGVHIVVEHA